MAGSEGFKSAPVRSVVGLADLIPLIQVANYRSGSRVRRVARQLSLSSAQRDCSATDIATSSICGSRDGLTKASINIVVHLVDVFLLEKLLCLMSRFDIILKHLFIHFGQGHRHQDQFL